MSKKKQEQKSHGGQQPRARPGGAGAGAQKHGPKKKLKPNTKKGGGGAALQDVPLIGRADASDASDLDVSDEDLEFVEEHRRQLGFLEKLNKAELDKSIRDKQERQAKEAADARKKAAEGGGSEEGEEDDDEEEDGEREGSDDEAAAAYEKAPRRVKDDLRDKSSAGLPIKTITGDVMYDKTAAAEGAAARRRGGKQAAGRQEAEMEAALAAAAAIQVEGVTITDDMEAALAETRRKVAEEETRRAKEEKKAAAAAAKKAEDAMLPPALRGLNLSSLEPAERRAKLQEAIAVAAQKLLAAPEGSAGELRTLQALVADEDSMTARLALLSLFAVFKDILPGYRIRPPTEKEMEVKVSKEVAKTRDYEQALLKAYQTYLRTLLDAAHCVQRGTGTLSHARVAVRCLCGLLAAQPHFNYTSDILQAVVPRMASSDAETRAMACEAVRALLEGGDGGDEGGAGRAALEAVQLIADMVRKRKCVAPAEVVRTLTCLRFRDVARPKREEDDEEGRRRKSKKAEKRDVKRRRKDDDVARTFKESSAGPDREELARQQSTMLEALFEIYFRVLKHCCAAGLAAPGGAAAAAAASADGAGPRIPSASLASPWSRSRLLKKCPLLHPALDGLARYTHLISVEYMNDLLAVFGDMLAGPALPLPERVRLLATVSALLRGQGEALNVDRRDLYVQLYDMLLQVPLYSLLSDDTAAGGAANKQQPDGAAASTAGQDAGEGGDDGDDEDIAMAAACEQAAAAAAAPPPPAGSDGATHGSGPPTSPAALLAGVLESLLCEPKMADMQRTAAFVKRMAGAALLAGPGEAMALWAAVARLLRRYPKLASMLEHEGEAPTVGGRTYDAFCSDPSEAGALATTLWEVCLASGPPPHYHPHLAQAAASLLALRPGAGAGGSGSAVQLTGPLGTPATIPELAEAYDASRGLMRPAPKPPRASAVRRGISRRRGGAGAELSSEFLEEVGRLAAEYGSTDGAGGWEGMEVDSEDDGDDDDEGCEDGWNASGRRRHAPASTSGGGGGGGGGGSDAVAAAALRRMFLESRRFHENRQLRLEKALAVERLKRFHIHLQQQQVAEALGAAKAPPPVRPGGNATAGGEAAAAATRSQLMNGKGQVGAGKQMQLQQGANDKAAAGGKRGR